MRKTAGPTWWVYKEIKLKRFWVVLLSLVILTGSPSFTKSATSANAVDLQNAVEKEAAQMAEVQLRLQVIESFIKERSTTVQGSQSDLEAKLGQLATELQAIQAKMDKNDHLLTDLTHRLDDLALRSKELTGRLDMLDGQIASLEKSADQGDRIAPVLKKAAIAAPYLPSSESSETKLSGEAVSSERNIVLPGRPIESDRVTALYPSEAYSLAYNDYLKGNYDLALTGFQDFLIRYKTTRLAADVQYWIGESFYGKKDYIKAIDAFEKVIRDYPTSEKVPRALLKSGYAWSEIGDKAKAELCLKKVVEVYPFSNEGTLARNKLAELK